jgi:hypothetical protein
MVRRDPWPISSNYLRTHNTKQNEDPFGRGGKRKVELVTSEFEV